MEENSKRRSRKSKLVPREYMDSDDENIAAMQEQIEATLRTIKNKSILKKLSYVPVSKPLQFNIKVEVEECNDNDNNISSSSQENLYTTSEGEKEKDINIATTECVKEETLNIKIDCVQSLCETLPKVPKPKEYYKFTQDQIQNEFEKLSKETTSYADKLIEINMRNYFGRNRKSSRLSYVDDRLLNIFRKKWKNWCNTFPEIRGIPLMYKCYLCSQAWWHLNDFRDHVIKHRQVVFDLETNCHECNVIAYLRCKPDVRDILIESNCWRCNRDSKQHWMLRKDKSNGYKCRGCMDKFYTCVLLVEHENDCTVYRRLPQAQKEIVECTQCSLRVESEDDLLKHMVLSHSVRSDVPVDMYMRLCGKCDFPYQLQALHNCTYKTPMTSCEFCTQKFTSHLFVLIHLNSTEHYYPCRVCGLQLRKQCMEWEHLLEHSHNYTSLYKCIYCTNSVLFTSLDNVNKHKLRIHGPGDIKNIGSCYEMIVVPKRMIETPSRPSTLLMEKEKKANQLSASTQKNDIVFDNAFQGLVSTLDKDDNTQTSEQSLNKTNVENTNAKKGSTSMLRLVRKTQVSTKSPQENSEGTSGIQKENMTENNIVPTNVELKKEVDNKTYKKRAGILRPSFSCHLDSKKSKICKIQCQENALNTPEISQENENVSKISTKVIDEMLVIPKFANFDSSAKNVNKDSQKNENKNICTSNIVNGMRVIPHCSKFKIVQVGSKFVIKQENDENNEHPQQEKSNCKEMEGHTEREKNYIEKHSQQETLDQDKINDSPQQLPVKVKIENEVEIKQEVMDLDIAEENFNNPAFPNNTTTSEQLHDVHVNINAENWNFPIKEEVVETENEYNNDYEGEQINYEIKEEEIDELYENDLIILDPSRAGFPTDFELQTNEQFLPPDDDDVEMQTLEPEVIVNLKYKRIYKCNKCDFEGPHYDYKLHLKQEGHDKLRKKTKCLNRNRVTKLLDVSAYTCTKCSNTYKSFLKYILHFNKMHDYEALSCPKCFRTLPSISTLQSHMNCHIKDSFVSIYVIKTKESGDNNKHQCKTCFNKVDVSQFFSHWEYHLEISQNTEMWKDFIPEMEDKPDLKNMLLLLQGLQTSPDPTINQLRFCCKCSRKFERKNECKRHFIEHLLKDAYKERHKYGSLKCQICGQEFLTSERYKRHMRDHGSLPLYKCELCDKAFSDSSNFSKHKKVHNLAVMVCDICSKKFTLKKYLEKHMEMHQKTKPWVCQECKRVFYTESSYKKHMARGKTRFKCPSCSVTFACLKDKWDHMWMVHKERKFEADCPLCSKSFRKHQDVKQHLRLEHKDAAYKYVVSKLTLEHRRRNRRKRPNPDQIVVKTPFRHTEAVIPTSSSS